MSREDIMLSDIAKHCMILLHEESKTNSQTQTVDWWLPGPGRRE